MKRPLIGARDFKAFIGQGEQAQGRSWRLTKEEDFVCIWREKKKRMKCEEGFLVLMCGKVFVKKGVQESSMEGNCVVASICSKTSGFFVQLVVLPKSTFGFVSNLNQF
jgi:hypothetical protein